MSCAGLMTQVLPQTSAGKSFQDGMAMGKFHGVIMAQTPTGWRMAMANLLGNSEGVVGTEQATAFAGHVVGGIDGFLDVAARLLDDLPISRVMSREYSSLRSTRISAAR